MRLSLFGNFLFALLSSLLITQGAFAQLCPQSGMNVLIPTPAVSADGRNFNILNQNSCTFGCCAGPYGTCSTTSTPWPSADWNTLPECGPTVNCTTSPGARCKSSYYGFCSPSFVTCDLSATSTVQKFECQCPAAATTPTPTPSGSLGTQTRTVVCRRSTDGVVVADSFCTAPKPAESQTCTVSAGCTGTWTRTADVYDAGGWAGLPDCTTWPAVGAACSTSDLQHNNECRRATAYATWQYSCNCSATPTAGPTAAPTPPPGPSVVVGCAVPGNDSAGCFAACTSMASGCSGSYNSDCIYADLIGAGATGGTVSCPASSQNNCTGGTLATCNTNCQNLATSCGGFVPTFPSGCTFSAGMWRNVYYCP